MASKSPAWILVNDASVYLFQSIILIKIET
jgi:hypothetical protein